VERRLRTGVSSRNPSEAQKKLPRSATFAAECRKAFKTRFCRGFLGLAGVRVRKERGRKPAAGAGSMALDDKV
jgi:hypothetical protein